MTSKMDIPLSGSSPDTTWLFFFESSDIFHGRGTQYQLTAMFSEVCTTDFPFYLLINSNLSVKSWSLFMTIMVHGLMEKSLPQ